MARRKSSMSALDDDRPRPAEAARRGASPSGSDSSKITLLQLSLGRSAQMFGIYSALALAFCAFLATVGDLAAGGFGDLPVFKEDYFLWVIALIVGLVLSLAVVALKWGPYVGQKGSGHFILSILGVVVSIIMLIIVLLHVTGQFVISYVAWIYPVSVLPISLTLISIAATWEGRSRRKVASMASAALLPIYFLFTFVPSLQPPPKGSLVLAFLFGALSIEMSGSLLLIIATATEAHKREIVKAGDTQLSLLREEYAKRSQAVEYKEKAVRAQESHFDSREQQLREYEAELSERMKSAEALHGKLEGEGREMKELERQLTLMKTDLQTKTEELTLRNRALKDREAEGEHLRDDITRRETAMLERDKEISSQRIDAAETLRKADERMQAATEMEKRLHVEGDSISKQRAELIQKEKDLELRESDIRMRIEELEAVQAKDQETKVRELKDWEEKVLRKERDLGRVEVDVRRLDKEVRSKSEELTREDGRIQQQRLQLSDREKELVTRQKQLGDLEATIAQRTRQMEQQIQAIKDARTRVDGKEQEYAQLFRATKEMEASAGALKDALRHQQEEFDADRQKAKVISENLSKEVKRLNEKNRDLQAKERELEQQRSDLQLRVLEVDRREKTISQGRVGTGADAETGKALELRERRLREREEEFRRRAYQKEKELEAVDAGLKEKERTLAVASGEEVEAAAEPGAVARGDKVKTGIARMDDLLYGGLKMNTNVLLVGPAFVGKEVMAYNFMAEGLKEGVPSIIVTTTKPPVEIAKELAPVLPSFMEYDQLGLVKWIDASGTLPAGSKPMKEGSTYRVNGATDYENIINVIDMLDSEFRAKKHPYFRLVFMTLSSSTTHTEENKAVAFVQKLVNRLRQTKEMSFMTLEKGMHTDQQIETLEHLMDGAFFFKVEGNKNLFQAVGLGEIQTREWIGYKFTNKTLIVGAFALQRIK